MCRENLVEQVGPVVEREAQAPNAPLGLQAPRKGEAVKAPHVLVMRDVEVVQQVVVEIVHAALFELLGEDALLIALLFEEHRRELRGQREARAVVTPHERLAHHRFALEVVVHVGRVEVGEAPFEKEVHHALDLRRVHRREVVLAQQRKTHAAESEFSSHIAVVICESRS